jgi:hypothetical protein
MNKRKGTADIGYGNVCVCAAVFSVYCPFNGFESTEDYIFGFKRSYHFVVDIGVEVKERLDYHLQLKNVGGLVD